MMNYRVEITMMELQLR